MRKLTLGICTSLALLGVVGLTAQGAFAKSDPGCGGKNDPYGTYPKGIYNSAWQLGKFDLVNQWSGVPGQEGKAGAVDGFHAVMNLCGTNSDPPKVFYNQGTLTTPGQGEVIRCANPKATGAAKAYCAKYGAHLPNGSFVGWGQSDQYSDPLGLQFDNLDPQLTVEAQGKSQFGKDAGTAVQKHCNKINGKNTSSITIACQRAEIDLILAKCGADIIWTLGPKVGGKYSFKMTGYALTCNVDFTKPLYVDGIDSIEVCGYGLPKAPATNKCGTPTANKTLWVAKNGWPNCAAGVDTSGAKGYQEKGTLTDGSSVIAETTAPVCWSS